LREAPDQADGSTERCREPMAQAGDTARFSEYDLAAMMAAAS
jgi:hypothetical protein